jgi:HSP20 family molecular chaperone IbpA
MKDLIATRRAPDLKEFLNSAPALASEVNQTVNDTQVIMASPGVSKSDVTISVNDLKAIAARSDTSR